MNARNELDRLLNHAHEYNLTALVDIQLVGEGPAWYAAAVHVITTSGQYLDKRPEWTSQSIRLCFNHGSHPVEVHARNPVSRIARLLEPGGENR